MPYASSHHSDVFLRLSTNPVPLLYCYDTWADRPGLSRTYLFSADRKSLIGDPESRFGDLESRFRDIRSCSGNVTALSLCHHCEPSKAPQTPNSPY